jgi:dolichol-phosphate mannosyltransferase
LDHEAHFDGIAHRSGLCGENLKQSVAEPNFLKGITNVQNTSYKFSYDIHGIIRIQSKYRLPELGYFRVDTLSKPADIVVDVRKPDASNNPVRKKVHYQDGLGSLGFDMHIEYGKQIWVTVSRLVSLSPHVLYTNVIEALLRWTFVQKGYVLIHAACMSFNGRAMLVTAKTDTGKTSTLILTTMNNPDCHFLSDDMTILSPDGTVHSYPKPMTISFHTLHAAKTAPLPLLNRIALQVQSRLHSKSGRKVGLTLSHSTFPAATLNTLVQMLIPPPKYMVDKLIPGVQFVKTSKLTNALVIERGPEGEHSMTHDEILQELIVNAEDAYGFPPYPIIGRELFMWGDKDLHDVERDIVSRALVNAPAQLARSSSFGWWKRIPVIMGSTPRTTILSEAKESAPKPVNALA